MIHKCHAIGCDTEVDPKFLMCIKHWRMMPKYLQREVWNAYRPGQEIDKNPSEEYLRVMHIAIRRVREIELQRNYV